jgi:anaerobic magnesium-protoporphyrin IX monomethyl ester cyclase
MRVVICTTPIRPVPTTYPPFGSLSIIHALKKAGYDPYFYDIDVFRPKFEDVEKFFTEYQPDVVGISAVVSTAYTYTKELTRMIKRVAPQAKVVVGGNMAASAEILHRLAGVDVCVIGEGEVIMNNIMASLEASGGRLDEGRLQYIKGITYVRKSDGELVFTGYETRLPNDELFVPDYDFLAKYSKIDNFIRSPLERVDFAQDPRTFQPHRKDKLMATLLTAKGCVARCTFCHRWDKGYRSFPADQIISHIKMLKEKYNVGFITFSDENFGSDRRQIEELLPKLKELDVLWQVGGVRVRSMNLPLLQRMKDAGCVAVYYGMETGSPTLLKVMEKNATVEDNLAAVKATKEAGLSTIYQIVLAMPGETDQTVSETTDFLKKATQDIFESPRSRMSINYTQALPGTPVYEYARAKGLIGKSLLAEEQYLITISDIDAEDDTKMLNFTSADYLTVRSWRRRIVLEVMKHYHDFNKTQVPSFPRFVAQFLKKKLFKKKIASADTAEIQSKVIDDYSKGGYFNLSRDLGYDLIVAYFYPIRHVFLTAWLLQDEFKRLGFKTTMGHIGQWIMARVLPAKKGVDAISLRKTMAEINPEPVTVTEQSMRPLRDGR